METPSKTPGSEWLEKHPPGKEVFAAIYARRSIGKKDAYSPEAQVAAGRKLCKERGWTVKYVIVEDDSRADFYRRPRWLLLLLKAIQQRFHVLVTWKVDRWARSMWDTLRVEQFLARHGIAFTSATEPFDTTTQFGRFAFRNVASFAELERGMISERIASGYAAKKRRRRWPNHRAPLGYRTKGSVAVPPTGDYGLEVCEADRATIEAVWTKFEALESGPAVAEELNKQGVKPKWGDAWSPNEVYKAIDNPLYIGQWPGFPEGDRVEALRIMPDDVYAARQAVRHRPVIRKPPQSEERKRKAMDRVFGQYKAQLEVLGLEQAAGAVDDVDVVGGVGDRTLDPALVRRIMGDRGTQGEPVGDAVTGDAAGQRPIDKLVADDETERRRLAETRRRKADLQWRKDLAQVLTL